MCLAVAQALLGFHSEHRWIRFALCHLHGCFPYLPHQPGYNKRLRAALPLIKQVIRDLAADSDFWLDNVWIADSTPVECARSRPAVRRSDMAGWAGYGYCASHSRWFWGLRLYLICTPAGMPVLWALADPKIGERDVLAAMLDVEPQLATARPGLTLITDKGFAGRETEADLAARGITQLAARTEGWVAGLQLAALSLRGQTDVARFVAAFSGSHRFVLDYLAGEVLDRQPEEVRTFLLQTSVLERLSGEMCDAVTGRTGGQVMLEQVERAGLFLVPLDEVRGWWRYHHLFADLLRARLQQQHPDRAAELHRNAAAWSEERGLAGDAVRHAVAAGEMTWAARLIEQYFDAAYNLRGEEATIRQWLSALPVDVIRSRVRLLLAQAHMAATSGDGEAVEPLLDAAERAPAISDEGPFEPTAGQAASWLVNPPALTTLLRSYLATLRGDAACGRGCCWRKARSPRPRAGRGNAASRRTTSRPTRGSRSTWCWPGCCSPRTAPAWRSGCWSGCVRRRRGAGRAASSRSGRCRRWRWQPAARRTLRWTPWPGR